MGPLTSIPCFRGSALYTRMSGRSSILRWSNAPPATAFPVQQTFPPYDGVGFIGSYSKLSGLSIVWGAFGRAPSPFSVFAFPPLDRKRLIGCAPRGGQASDDCHLLIPIV